MALRSFEPGELAAFSRANDAEARTWLEAHRFLFEPEVGNHVVATGAPRRFVLSREGHDRLQDAWAAIPAYLVEEAFHREGESKVRNLPMLSLAQLAYEAWRESSTSEEASGYAMEFRRWVACARRVADDLVDARLEVDRNDLGRLVWLEAQVEAMPPTGAIL